MMQNLEARIEMMGTRINGNVRKAYDVYMVLGDQHFPFEEKEAIKITTNVAKDIQPDEIVLLGDIVDFYQVSQFDKDPKRVGKLQEDLDKGIEYLKDLRKACPKSRMTYLEGNHENRLVKALMRNPEFYGLRVLTVPKLLELDKLNIRYVSQKQDYLRNNFMLIHGDVIRKHSAYTAKAMIDKKGVSGISGHSHRMGFHAETDYAGAKLWAENGCLCELNPEYMDGKPNWQHGFNLIYFKKGSQRFQIEPIFITHGKCLVNGSEYTSQGKVHGKKRQ